MKKMRQKNLKAFFTNKILIVACVISPLVFFGVAAVLADVWSGPANRTTAGTCDVYHYHQGTFVCRETCGQPEYHICDNACASAGGMRFFPDGKQPWQFPAGCDGLRVNLLLVPRQQRLVQRVGTLHLSGNEPVSGYSISGFDSDQDGYLCSGSSCDWNFPQGVTTNLGYWANSSFGDQSNEAYASMSVDTSRANPDSHHSLPERLERLEQIRPRDGFCLGHGRHIGRGQRGLQQQRFFLHCFHGRSVQPDRHCHRQSWKYCHNQRNDPPGYHAANSLSQPIHTGRIE